MLAAKSPVPSLMARLPDFPRSFRRSMIMHHSYKLYNSNTSIEHVLVSLQRPPLKSGPEAAPGERRRPDSSLLRTFLDGPLENPPLHFRHQLLVLPFGHCSITQFHIGHVQPRSIINSS